MVCTLGSLVVVCPVYTWFIGSGVSCVYFIGSGVSCVHLVHWKWCVLCTLGSLVVICSV